VDLDPVDRITADAIGEPGERTFYLQARKGPELVTIMVEKQQVELLASSILEILSRVGKETAAGPPEEAMELEEFVEPMWRAGRLSIGYLEERDLLLLEVEEVLDEEEEVVREAERVRLADGSDGGCRGTARWWCRGAARGASSAATPSTRRATCVPR